MASVNGFSQRLRAMAPVTGFGQRLRSTASVNGFGQRLRLPVLVNGFGQRRRSTASVNGFGGWLQSTALGNGFIWPTAPVDMAPVNGFGQRLQSTAPANGSGQRLSLTNGSGHHGSVQRLRPTAPVNRFDQRFRSTASVKGVGPRVRGQELLTSAELEQQVTILLRRYEYAIAATGFPCPWTSLSFRSWQARPEKWEMCKESVGFMSSSWGVLIVMHGRTRSRMTIDMASLYNARTEHIRFYTD